MTDEAEAAILELVYDTPTKSIQVFWTAVGEEPLYVWAAPWHKGGIPTEEELLEVGEGILDQLNGMTQAMIVAYAEETETRD